MHCTYSDLLLGICEFVMYWRVDKADNAGLQERAKVHKIRVRVERALSYMLRHSHAGDSTAFDRLTIALGDLRYVADGYDNYTSHLHVTSPSGCVNVPALLSEVMSFAPSDSETD